MAKSKRKQLKVRRHVWRPADGSQGPRTEYWDGRRWKPVASFADAREIARRKGYAGITIEPC